MMKNLLYIFLLSVFLTSCDPGHDLVFINKTKSDAFVQIKTHSDTSNLYKRYKVELDESDSIIVIKPDSIYKIYFGIGTWHDEEMKEFSQLVEEIKIESEYKTIIYKSGQQIEELLKNNRKASIGNVTIKIEILN